MSLSPHIKREVRLIIRCSFCLNEDSIFNETRGTAAGLFRQAGWVVSNGDPCCPRCIKAGKVRP